MKNKLLLYLYSWCLLILLIACNEVNELHCDNSSIDSSIQYPVVITDIFSYFPTTYKGLTYINYIDQIVSNKRFFNKEPYHSFSFKDCDEAQAMAEKDYDHDRPALIQFNGIGGNFPLRNEIYSKVLGLYIENTGCYIYSHADCYNERIWTLLDDHFGYDMRQNLDIIELQHYSLAIDINKNEAIKVDEMPTILKMDSIAMNGSDTVKCAYPGFLLGRYLAKVNKKGKTEILEYLEGSLDCECESKMRKYFESVIWAPAIINRDSIDSIVAFQFLN